MLVDVAQGGVDDKRACHNLTMQSCELRCVERYENVGHDASASIHRAMTAQCLTLQRVGKVYRVCRVELAMLVSFLDVHSVVLLVALGVGLLNASTRRCVVVSHGEAYHRAIVKLDRALHESLAKRAATYDGAAVLVLHCTRQYLGSRSCIFVDKHVNLALCKASVARSTIFHASLGASFGVDDEVVLLKELLYYLHRCLQIASAIVLKVDDEVAHAVGLQRVDSLHKLAVGGCTKRADTYVSQVWAYHVVGINRIYGYLAACHGEVEQFVDATALDAELYLRTTWTTQTSHYLRTFHLDTRNGGVGNGDDTVAGEYTHLL